MKVTAGYSRAQIALHWVVAILIAVQYLFHEGMAEAWHAVRDGREVTGFGSTFHIITGSAILLFALWRLVLRVSRGAPDAPEGTSGLMKLASGLVHLGIYGLLLLIPLSGLVGWYFDVIRAVGVHELLFNLLTLLVFLHVAAALFHQYVLKDRLIRRMFRPE